MAGEVLIAATNETGMADGAHPWGMDVGARIGRAIRLKFSADQSQFPIRVLLSLCYTPFTAPPIKFPGILG